MPHSKNTRGFTLVELLVAMTATVVIAALVVQAFIALQAEQAVRKKVSELQTTARRGLEMVERDLRHASLGTSTGVVWQASGLNRVSRPAIQVFTGLPGGGTGAIRDAKPDTDAVLVVEATPGLAAPRTVTLEARQTSVGGIPVASATGFSGGQAVLLGDYGDATWGTIASANAGTTPHQITLAGATNVLPGQPVPKLGAGAPLRLARARLYYVNVADELVRLTLSVPRAPLAAEIAGREVIADGVENMQLDCEMTAGTALGGCDGVLDAGDPVSVEAIATFGTFGAGKGPRVSSGNVSRLRSVVVNLAVRSRTPLLDVKGDGRIALSGASGTSVQLGPGSTSGVPADGAYARRSYRLAAGVRNTSLESL